MWSVKRVNQPHRKQLYFLMFPRQKNSKIKDLLLNRKLKLESLWQPKWELWHLFFYFEGQYSVKTNLKFIKYVHGFISVNIIFPGIRFSTNPSEFLYFPRGATILHRSSACMAAGNIPPLSPESGKVQTLGRKREFKCHHEGVLCVRVSDSMQHFWGDGKIRMISAKK